MQDKHCEIMNKGKFVFSQIIDFLPRYEFDKIVNKTLWGHSENAVKIHLWVAICTYLLVAIIKAKCGSDYSITEVEMLLRVSVFERMNIRDLLTRPANQLLNQNQNVKELSLFEN